MVSTVWMDFLRVEQIKQGPSEPAIQYLEPCRALFKRVQISAQHQICVTIEGNRGHLTTTTNICYPTKCSKF